MIRGTLLGWLLALQSASSALAFLGNGRHFSSSYRQREAVVRTYAVASSQQRSSVMSAVQTSLGFQAAASLFPHPAKALTGGEDAYFVLPKDLGVFDGVGGWSVVPEANAGLFSRTFANLTAENIASQREAGVQQVSQFSAPSSRLRCLVGHTDTTKELKIERIAIHCVG